MEVIIGVVKKSHLKKLSKIYVELYADTNIGEYWNETSAYKLLEYWYNSQNDLFLVACIDNEPVGAVMSGIKPWWNGIHLVDTEIFVAKEFQKLGIAKKLYIKHFEIALRKYDVVEMEAHTYQDDNGFPLKWYEKMGFVEDKQLKIIVGNVKTVLNNLKK